jgi:hypothetical protein
MIGLVCIAKDENQYFDEWIRHHLKVGFTHVFIYDNNSKEPIIIAQDLITKVSINEWEDTNYGSQSRAYMHACSEYDNFEYLAFFDVDEFYMSKTMNVNTDLFNLGVPIALGIYWRIYGNPKPFETRQPVENYTNWHGDKHIKSIIAPTFVKSFPDPHKAELINEKKGMYIDENNNQILEPIGVHTSNNIWIKHVFTRSRQEFAEKMQRGDANTREKNRTWQDFEHYNSLCINF